jgi:hypothetical protein
MGRNWQLMYDVLKTLINEGYLKKEMFDFVHEYHLHLLHDICAVKVTTDNYYTFTWLGVEIMDVLQSMINDGIDLNSIDGNHPRIVNCINPCIERMHEKRKKKPNAVV